MKILYHLVSGQKMPIYISDKLIHPDKNVYLFSRDTEKDLPLIKSVIKTPSEAVEISPYNFMSVYKQITDILSKTDGNELILDFTGGTKISSFACLEAFRQACKTAVYINTEEYKYITFAPDNSTPAVKRIEIKADLEDIFHLNGQTPKFQRFDASQEPASHKIIREFLIANFRDFRKFIFEFINMQDKTHPVPISKDNGCFEGSFISFTDNTSHVRFVYNGREYLNLSEDGDKLFNYLAKSTWFEEACYLELEKLNIFDSIYLNVEVLHKNKKTTDKYDAKNEFDILALQGVTPVLFECKSGKIPSDAVEKLVALKGLYLGKYTPKYILTYEGINDGIEAQRIIREKMAENKIGHVLLKNIKTEFQNKLLFSSEL